MIKVDYPPVRHVSDEESNIPIPGIRLQMVRRYPTPTKWQICEKDVWVCSILAMDSDTKYLQLPVYPTDTFEPIEPIDLIKYINYLTNAGAHYLKELKNVRTNNHTL